MNNLIKGLLGIGVSLSLVACAPGNVPVLSGDSTQSDRPEVTAALSHDTEYASGTVILEGALIGAALGCGIGLLIGGDASSCLAGAAVGGVGGGVAGAAVAEENKRQILAEDQEDRLYAELQSEGEDLRAYNNKVEIAVARLQNDLTTLERQKRKKQISAEQYEAQKASIKRDSAKLASHTSKQRETVEERNSELEEYELSDRTRKAVQTNLAQVFDAADQADDFNRRATKG